MDRQEIKLLLNYTENYSKDLNSIQLKFIASLKNLYNATGVLTRRQIECLYDLKDHIPEQTPEVYESEPDHYPAQYASINCNAFVWWNP